MYLQQLWRYPAKSMAGESLESIELTPLGLEGDRQILVQSSAGRILTARTHHKLLGLKATYNEGNVLINGLEWHSAAAQQLVSDTLGQQVHLIRHEGPERFDILPLLVATDGTIDHMRFDARRLRPNLIIGGVPGLDERTWPGRILEVGPTRIEPAQLRGRCVMTTYHPDTLVQDLNVLRNIVNQLDGVMALDTAVLTPGRLTLNDPVTLQP